MGCFGVCNGKSNKRKQKRKQNDRSSSIIGIPRVNQYKKEEKEDILALDVNISNLRDIPKDIRSFNKAQSFTFKELATATANFKRDYFLGEGGFGKVYKGYLERLNQEVAIKRLDRSGGQGIKEFIIEVYTLSLADHANLVQLLGFCAEGSQRLLVYEYMPLGSLESHLHDLQSSEKVLDWFTRMKIAVGTAKGIEYLHNRMKPPLIYRDLKCSNILLSEGYHPKLSDFGLAKVGPSGDQTHVSTRVMGTYGYCAPEYVKTGKLTFPSDIYSFGVVLLELITGRKALDQSRARADRNLVQWAQPMFRDRSNYTRMVDPNLKGRYPLRGLYQALAIASMCVSDQPNMRPMTSDIVLALHYLAMPKIDPNHPVQYSGRVAPTCSA